jgi:hypothetical protein
MMMILWTLLMKNKSLEMLELENQPQLLFLVCSQVLAEQTAQQIQGLGLGASSSSAAPAAP